MAEQSMFRERAEVYDLIYSSKPYAREAAQVRDLLAKQGIADGARLLEGACGSGSYLAELRQWYEVSGFDLSSEILSIARKKVPEVHLFQADLCTFEVDEPVDVFVCLFSSIGYVHPHHRLAQAAERIAAAVRPGGTIVIEPWVTENFRVGAAALQTHETPDLKVVRAVVSQCEERLSILDFHWLVVRAGEGVEHFTDRHALYMYSRAELLDTFAAAGFELHWAEDPILTRRGLLVGTRLG